MDSVPGRPWLVLLGVCFALAFTRPAECQFIPADLHGGSVESELLRLNRQAQPQITRILHNYALTVSNPFVSNSLAFGTGEFLQLNEWKTTVVRMKESKTFSTVALELETADEGKTYNANVRTSKKSNTAGGVLLGFLKGLPLKTSYLDIWNIGGSPVHFNSRYRWNSDKRRAEAQVLVPVPVPGMLFLEFGTLWRSEQWELSDQDSYRFKSSGVHVKVKRIQNHRLEIGGGLEYSNRAGAADVGSFLASTRVRLFDGRYKSHVLVDGFVARASVLGDVNYSGATLGSVNRLAVSEDSGTFIDFSVRGGTTRGQLPVEDYFILGVDGEIPHLLRGHKAAAEGRYGRSPMGTDFILMNSDIERRVWTVPVAKIEIKGELFLDAAKVFDRNRVFPQAGWFFDAGVAARIQLPGSDLVVLYGRSLNHGGGIIAGYIERHFW